MSANMDWTNAYINGMDKAKYEAMAGAMAEKMMAEVSEGKLPCLNLPFWNDLKAGLVDLKPKLAKFKHMLVLGIGGSALGARAMQKAFAPGQDQPGHDGPWLWISDNVDSHAVDAYFSKLPPQETVVVVISKSGGTIETISQYFLAKKWLEKSLPETWKEHLILVTDKENGFLRQEVNELKTMSMEVPDNLGGRYSALSAVGMIPAMFMGIDYEAVGQGSLDINAPLASPELDAEIILAHPSFQMAVWNMALMEKGYDQLIFFCYIPKFAMFGAWFSQLWAESLGKQGKGSMPIASVGVTDQHSVNQMYLAGPKNKGCLFLTAQDLPKGPTLGGDLPEAFSYIRNKPFGELIHAEGLGTRMAMVMSDIPLLNLDLADDSEYMAGRLMGFLKSTTLLTGWMLDINPVDQPAVELGKRLAKARLGASGLDKETKDLEAFLKTERTFQKF